MHFQNIDFDIDIEIFGNFDIDIGIDIEKNGENIENFRSEKTTSASLTLSFGIDFSFFSPLCFDFVTWVLVLPSHFFLDVQIFQYFGFKITWYIFTKKYNNGLKYVTL